MSTGTNTTNGFRLPDMINEQIMTPEEQLDRWLQGSSVHNGISASVGECCPDFSCCTPETAWPLELRVAFKNANEEEREKLLVQGLGALLDCHEVRKVNIIR